MKKTMSVFIFLLVVLSVTAQNEVVDSVFTGKMVINKDSRLDILAKNESRSNSYSTKSAKGYRLLVLSSNDRQKVMDVRAKLLQQYPEEKVYMAFQNPFIKLKFGDFVEKPDAEKYKNLLTRAHLVTTNIYIVPEAVELKPDKNKGKKEEN